jgi:serine/threonine protein kinase
MSQAHAVQLGQQLALALAALHQRGIVHRDLKPENLMLVADPSVPGGERVKILDFGIAKLAAGTAGPGAEVTRTGMLLGTPTYMSPEQCRGSRSVDAKADVYALGVILYQLLGGQPPFIGSGAADVMTMHLFEQPAPLSSLAEVSPRLGRLVHQMLHKSPAERPSMAQVAARLADELLPTDQSDDQTKMTHRLEDEPPQVQPRLAHLSLPQLVMPTMVSRTAPDLKRPEELGQPSADSLRTLHRARTLRIVATLVAITTAILFASILLLVMLRR